MNGKLLIPFSERFKMLHAFLHASAISDLITSYEAVQMISVICPLCDIKEDCFSDMKEMALEDNPLVRN